MQIKFINKNDTWSFEQCSFPEMRIQHCYASDKVSY